MSHLTSCLNPHIVRNRYTHELICVPCGKCSSCLSRKSALWVARLREESACHTYTMFGTLTYDDTHLPRQSAEFQPDKVYTDEYLKAYNASKDFIDAHNGMIPCVSVSDIQGFFKRLRASLTYYLQKNYGKGNKADLRYFAVSEYGPTTLRPHYHLLLWFDDRRLYPVIKEHIFKAWQSKTCHSTLSSFLLRNKWKFVSGHCEQYCAQYLNTTTHLPAILTQKPFRTFHLQSSCPPIGTIRLLRESVKSILSGDACTVALRRCSSLQNVIIPLWRGIENRFFPKCLSFAKLSSGDRRMLYQISEYCPYAEKERSFETFYGWVLSEWFSDVPSVRLLRFVCTSSPQDGERFRRCLRAVYLLSLRIKKLADCSAVTVSSYVTGIETYYLRKDYDGLLMQLNYQEYLSRSRRCDEDLRFYPFLVDTLFYENYRNLSSSSYSSYLEQFGLGKVNDFMFFRSNSRDFKEVKSFCDKIRLDNTKTRVKKDYVSTHPECVYTYRDMLRSFV